MISRIVSLLCLACLVTVAQAPGPRKPPPWEKLLVVGRVLYRENCSVCHEVNKPENKKKLGPSLFRFFQNEKTPLTGVKPSASYMVTKIKDGGIVMPAFGDILTADQIEAIVAFIRSRH